MKEGFKIALGGIFSILAVVFSIVSKVSLPILVLMFVLKLAGLLSIGWGPVILVPALAFLIATFLQASFIVFSKMLLT